MKYYLLSKALKLDRFFDSIEEIDVYIWAKTSARFFSTEFIKAHLEENSSYSYLYRGIDIVIYKNVKKDKVDTITVHSNLARKEAF